MKRLLILALCTFLAITLASCTTVEHTEEHIIPTGSSVSEIDQMIAQNADLPEVEDVTLPKPYDFVGENKPALAQEEPADQPIKQGTPLEYRQKEHIAKDASGSVALSVFAIQLGYESLESFSFDTYNDLGRTIKDPILQVMSNDVILRDYKFSSLAHKDMLARNNFPVHLRIGDQMQTLRWKFGEYVNNSFVSYAEFDKDIPAKLLSR